MTNFIVFNHYNGQTLSGQKDLSIGTEAVLYNNILKIEDSSICFITSQVAIDYFVGNDDNEGSQRGKLINRIKNKLSTQDSGYQTRWNKIWESKTANKYKRKDSPEHWLWDISLNTAKIYDLNVIAKLIGA